MAQEKVFWCEKQKDEQERGKVKRRRWKIIETKEKQRK